MEGATSEALADEVEAINAIYGPGSLEPVSGSAGDYILRLLPEGETSSLNLHFPSSYPDSQLAILSTHSSGLHGRRGAAAHHLALFRDAVAAVYEPGQVCLFDAVERFKELLAEEEQGAEQGAVESTGQASDGDRAEWTPAPAESASPDLPGGDAETALAAAPPWILSEAVTELKSTFVARCARVSSTEQAGQFVRHLLATDKRIRAATHNITAWRVRGSGGTSFQDCDDDGETAAGGRLLRLLQLMDLWDVVVVVTRWYGGQKLGPRRFALINQVARNAIVRAGLVDETPRKKKAHGK